LKLSIMFIQSTYFMMVKSNFFSAFLTVITGIIQSIVFCANENTIWLLHLLLYIYIYIYSLLYVNVDTLTNPENAREKSVFIFDDIMMTHKMTKKLKPDVEKYSKLVENKYIILKYGKHSSFASRLLILILLMHLFSSVR
ncbi:hypothetical protein L9F63_018724, partial [Diploptera punctata]